MSDVFSSVFSAVNGFVYRCANDSDYTMQFMEGSVLGLTGYPANAILSNAEVSYVGLTADQDQDRVFAEVDAAIEARETWDVFYRLTHANGHLVPVRERGNAIYSDGELTHLEGLVVSAEAESRLIDEMDTMVSDTRLANQEIVDLTQQITHSLRALKMLSVNARIEAAKSGDAGRGFSVVANEIRALADENSAFTEVIHAKLAANR